MLQSNCRGHCHSYISQVLIVSKCAVCFVKKFSLRRGFLCVIASLLLTVLRVNHLWLPGHHCIVASLIPANALFSQTVVCGLFSSVRYVACTHILILCTNAFSLKQCSKLFLIAKC